VGDEIDILVVNSQISVPICDSFNIVVVRAPFITALLFRSLMAVLSNGRDIFNGYFAILIVIS